MEDQHAMRPVKNVKLISGDKLKVKINWFVIVPILLHFTQLLHEIKVVLKDPYNIFIDGDIYDSNQ